jgi:hypothetical protein
MKDIKVLKVGDKTYELCLTARKAAIAEKKIGKSILSLLNKEQKEDESAVSIIPTMNELALILSAEIISEEVSEEKALEIMDQFFDEGHGFGDLFLLITEALGFLKVAPKIPQKAKK